MKVPHVVIAVTASG